MKIKTYLGVATAALLLLALLGACSQNPIGIFESIELERKILDDRNLGNSVNVMGYTKAGSRYFAAAGTLYYRNVNDPDYVNGDRAQWAVVTAPGANYTTSSVVTSSVTGTETVYAVFSDLTGGTSGIYPVTPGATSPATGTALFANGADGGAVVRVIEVFAVTDVNGDWLVASVQGDVGVNDYSLYKSSDGVTFSEIAGTSITTPWTDAAFNSNTPGPVAFMSASTVYVDDADLTSDDGALKETLTGGGWITTERLSGMVYDSEGGSSKLWLADNAGHIYTSAFDEASTWDRSGAHPISTTNDTATPFTDFAVAQVDSTTWSILVGTRGYGYRVIGDASTATFETPPVSPAVDGSNYQAADLAGAVVQTFYVDPALRTDYPVPTADGNPYEFFDGYLVFAGTTNQGLWRALSYPGAIQWVRE